jgi:DNA-binding IclR family transcriptional regulator
MIVPQAARMLDLLEYFAKVQQPLGLTDISEALDWPRSTAVNLITTLAQRGYLYEPRPRKGYYPTERWLAVLEPIINAGKLPDTLLHAVDEIAMAANETVAVAAPSGSKAVLIHIIESPEPIRFSATPGYAVPIHATSSGRALLAQYKPRERSSVLRKADYIRLSDVSLMSAEEVEDELFKAEQRGWHESLEGDLTGVALPVTINERRLSVVVAGPTERMRERIPDVARIIRNALDRCLTA